MLEWELIFIIIILGLFGCLIYLAYLVAVLTKNWRKKRRDKHADPFYGDWSKRRRKDFLYSLWPLTLKQSVIGLLVLFFGGALIQGMSEMLIFIPTDWGSIDDSGYYNSVREGAAFLIVMVLGGYLLLKYSNFKQENDTLATENAKINSEKEKIENLYKFALVKLAIFRHIIKHMDRGEAENMINEDFEIGDIFGRVMKYQQQKIDNGNLLQKLNATKISRVQDILNDMEEVVNSIDKFINYSYEEDDIDKYKFKFALDYLNAALNDQQLYYKSKDILSKICNTILEHFYDKNTELSDKKTRKVLQLNFNTEGIQSEFITKLKKEYL